MARPTPIIVPGGLSSSQTGTTANIDAGAIINIVEALKQSKREQTAQQQAFQALTNILNPPPAAPEQVVSPQEAGVQVSPEAGPLRGGAQAGITAPVAPSEQIIAQQTKQKQLAPLFQTMAQTAESRKQIGEQFFKQLTPKPEKTTPATDIDDFVADADAESVRITGRKLTPGARNKARLEIKRAQAKEASSVRIAERTADAITAEKISRNSERGKALAIIETAGAIIKAKGEITPIEKQTIAKKRMTGNLAKLANHFNDLDSLGGIVNIEKGTMSNILAATRASALGQQFGRITGTDAQSIRKAINNIKPLLIQDIRQSTDMGARGLDSERELDFYLQAATDEKSDIQSNIAAIVVLDEAFGEGEIAAQLRELTDESLISRISGQGQLILDGGLKKEKVSEKKKKVETEGDLTPEEQAELDAFRRGKR